MIDPGQYDEEARRQMLVVPVQDPGPRTPLQELPAVEEPAEELPLPSTAEYRMMKLERKKKSVIDLPTFLFSLPSFRPTQPLHRRQSNPIRPLYTHIYTVSPQVSTDKSDSRLNINMKTRQQCQPTASPPPPLPPSAASRRLLPDVPIS